VFVVPTAWLTCTCEWSGGYHGGCFLFPGDAPAQNCVDRDDWIVASYNDVADTQRKIEESGDVAAVLVEGMQGQGPCIVGSTAFLHQVQASARKVGAVFILDEVMTSRLSAGGLQALEGLAPDITTMGKYLGGGITFGAFGGREEVMRVYGTFCSSVDLTVWRRHVLIEASRSALLHRPRALRHLQQQHPLHGRGVRRPFTGVHPGCRPRFQQHG
jgi:glutamate-1-semialdehyde aminotransferase